MSRFLGAVVFGLGAAWVILGTNLWAAFPYGELWAPIAVAVVANVGALLFDILFG